MRRREHLAWTAAALAGCVSATHESAPGPVQPSSHVPDTDAPARAVGLLRRLVVLPAAIEFTPKDPRDCFETCDPQALLRNLAHDVPSTRRRRRSRPPRPHAPSPRRPGPTASCCCTAR